MWDRPEALAWLTRLLLGLTALAVVLAGLRWTVQAPLWSIRVVEVKGRLVHVTGEQIRRVVHSELRGNFLTLDLRQSRAAFEKLPWVRRASVRRHWPDRLLVEVEEHEALARWGDQGLVNRQGEVFVAASDDALPVFEGPRQSAAAMAEGHRAFAEALAPLGRQVARLLVSERQAWALELDDGTRVELGRERALERLQRFARAWVLQPAQAQGPLVVDLRYPNGFAVRARTQDNGA